MKIIYFFLAAMLITCADETSAQRKLGAKPTDTGGVLMPEQACYDVKWYDLNIEIFPEQQSIQSKLTLHAVIVQPSEFIVLDLDTLLSIDSVYLSESLKPLHYERKGWKVWVKLGTTYQPGKSVTITVAYGGIPRKAQRPPWVGGIVWSKTLTGSRGSAWRARMTAPMSGGRAKIILRTNRIPYGST